MSTASEQLALPGMVADPAEDSDQLTVFDVIAATAHGFEHPDESVPERRRVR